jgi:hypothetical protein
MDALVLDGDDVCGRPVFRVSGHLPRPQLPTESGAPEEINRWLVFLHFGWRDERGEDNARFPTIDDRVILIT